MRSLNISVFNSSLSVFILNLGFIECKALSKKACV